MQSKVHLAQYLHASCLSPPVTTWTKAINNNQFFNLAWSHYKIDPASFAKKNMRILRVHEIRETRSVVLKNQVEKLQDHFPAPNELNIKIEEVCYVLHEASDFTSCMDITRHFHKISSSGNQCMLVEYHYDGNCIHAAAIKNKKGNTIIEA